MSVLTASRFRDLRPWSARFVLAALALLIAFGVSLPEDRTWAAETEDAGIGDAALFRGINQRVRGGDDYYAATAEELQAHGYGTSSVFNFRLPTLAFVMAVAPIEGTARVLLGVLGILNLLLWTGYWLESEKSLPNALLGGLLLLSASLPCFLGSALYFTEVWAGALISISLVCRAQERWGFAVAAGVAALFVRELALPFVGIMGVFALMEGRFREASAWIAGVVGFAVYFTLHATLVADVAADSALTANRWFQWGGWVFLLNTVRSNALLLISPQWVSAVALPLAFLGLAGWRSRDGWRAFSTLTAYAFAFLVVGQAFNVYWGLVTVQLVAIGVAYSVAAAIDLSRAAMGRARSA